MEGQKEKRLDFIHAITAPLGFFALSLLIVEGFLTTALVGSNLDPASKFWGMIIGAGLFLFVVFGVWLLVWIKPTHLTFSENSHLAKILAELENEKIWRTSDDPVKKFKVDESSLASPVSSNINL